MTRKTAEELFTYRAPDSVTKHRHDAINHAAASLKTIIDAVAFEPIGFDEVNACCTALYSAIEENCPPSPDMSAALRCVRLCRNGLNDFIVNRDMRCIEFAHQQLLSARYNANGGVAIYCEKP